MWWRLLPVIVMAVAFPACQSPPPPASSEATPPGAAPESATASSSLQAPAGPEAAEPAGETVEDQEAEAATPAPTRHSHGHAHAAPRGGALVELGDEFAHLEVLFDSASGRVTVYVLDGEAVGAVRVSHEALTLTIEGGETVTLPAVASVLTGETAGDSSHFEAAVPALAGARRVAGVLSAITVRGITFEGVRVEAP